MCVLGLSPESFQNEKITETIKEQSTENSLSHEGNLVSLDQSLPLSVYYFSLHHIISLLAYVLASIHLRSSR